MDEVVKSRAEHGADYAGLEQFGGGKGLARPKERMKPSADGKTVVEQMRDILAQYFKTVTQLFRDWDDDNSGTVSKEEFRRALPVLGLTVEREDAEALFDTFDEDLSGEIDYEELSKHLRAGAGIELDAALQAGAMGEIETAPAQAFALRKGLNEMQSKIFGRPINIDASSDVPVIEQLQKELSEGSVLGRVVDIFREWDDDGSGQISKREFGKAMSILGVDREVLDELFDSIDSDVRAAPCLPHLARRVLPRLLLLAAVLLLLLRLLAAAAAAAAAAALAPLLVHESASRCCSASLCRALAKSTTARSTRSSGSEPSSRGSSSQSMAQRVAQPARLWATPRFVRRWRRRWMRSAS